MKNKTIIILMLLAIPIIVWAAGTVTDYITLTPAAAPGAVDEATIYYNSTTDLFYGHDDGAWYAMGPETIQLKPISAAPLNTEGAFYYDSDTDRCYYYTGAAVWEPFGQTTLNEAYNNGSAITVDGASITFESSLAAATDILAVVHTGVGGTGQLLQLQDVQTGAHSTMIVDCTAGNASSGGLLIRDNLSDTTGLAYLLQLASVDNTQVVTDGLLITATTASGMTDAIDISDDEIVNAINIGSNSIIGVDVIIDFKTFDLDAAGDFYLAETGGSSADPDFQSNGYYLLGVTGGGALGDATNRTNFSHDGVITFSANARPTHTDWIPVHMLDLVMTGFDYTPPDENEAGSSFHWSTLEFDEANVDEISFAWAIPDECDVSTAINVYLVWESEDAGGDTCTWKATYCAIKTNNNETPCDPTTALNTPIAADQTDVQYGVGITTAGIIDGATLEDGEIIIWKISLTTSADTTKADLIGIKINYTMDSL